MLQTLAHLVPLYPTLHRALLPSLSNLALRYLNGSSPKPIPPRLLEAASELYCVLHYTGGKVGAANHWRKSVDDTLGFAWGALQNLRTTFPVIGGYQTSTDTPFLLLVKYLCRRSATTSAAASYTVTRRSHTLRVPTPGSTKGSDSGVI